jgi:SAM-dependent methyltransferase
MQEADGGSGRTGASQPPEPRPRFAVAPAPRPWERLAYVAKELNRRLRGLIADLGVPPGSTVLDLGCGASPYRDAFGSVEYLRADLERYEGIDIVVAPDGRVPLPDDSVDFVLSTQVLEHAADPERYVGECARVLKPGGRLLLSTHGIMFYHPDPQDYWRWTPAGLELLLSRAGLEVKRVEGIVGLTAAGLTLAHEPFVYSLPKPLQPPLVWLVQVLCRIADRFEPPAARRHNALVFAVVAEPRR